MKEPCTRSAPLLACSLVVLLVSATAFCEDTIVTRAFSIKFRRVEEAFAVINSLLSNKGSITMQPHLKMIVVQDYEMNLRQIEEAVTRFDVPPPSVEISVKLVLAKKTAVSNAISREIKDIGKLGEVLRFNDYTLLDSGVIISEEGRSSVLGLARDYQVNFLADVIQEGNGIIRLKNFQLKKRKRPRSEKESFSTLLSLTLNLRNGETLVLGASRFEESDQALLVILLGKVRK